MCHHMSRLHSVVREEGKWKENIFDLTHAVTLLLTIVQLPPLRANVSVVMMLCIYIISDISYYWLIMTLQPAWLKLSRFYNLENCDLSLLTADAGTDAWAGARSAKWNEVNNKQKIFWKVESGVNRLLACNQDTIDSISIS